MYRFSMVGCLLLLLLVCQGRVKADLVLTFDAPTYSINIGGTVDVQVFLIQQGGTTTLTDDGLRFAKFAIGYGTPTPTAKVVNGADVTANVEFDDLADVSTDSDSVTLDAISSGAIFPPGGDPNRILLGTFTFTGIMGGSTALSFVDFPEADNFLSGLFDPLDSQINFSNTATINVTAVPEPSPLSLLGSVLMIWLIRRKSHSRIRLSGR